jgi:hypothetical protein
MTDDELLRLLRSVGMAAFVLHLPLFQAATDPATAAERLHLATGWQLTACSTRVFKARAILQAGRRNDALALIAAADGVADAARDAARRLLQA